MLSIYIVVFLVLYFFVVFIFPTARVRRKTGVIPFIFNNTDSLQDYIRKVLTLINFLVFLIALINPFPLIYQYLIPVKWLEISILKYIGFILIHFAFLWIVTAQVQMGNSWRVGIDLSTKTELKTKGLFSVSRNPVCLGMLTTLTGIFMIIPNAFTLIVLIASLLLFQIEIRLEEEYLVNAHGKTYVEYCKKVGRWF